MFTFPLTLFSGELDNTTSIVFDGVDEYITMPDSSSLDISPDITMSCWFKTTSTTNVTLMSKWGFAAGGHRAYLLSVSVGKIRVIISEDGLSDLLKSKDYLTTAAFNDGNWHHVAATLDTSGNVLKIYVDGVDQAVVKSFDFALTSIVNSADPVNIGAFNSGGVQLMDGHIDEPSLWDTALSASEVTAIYNSGTPIDLKNNHGNYVSAANLVAWWRMGDIDTYPTVLDQTANNNDGTMTNMSAANIVNDVPFGG